MSHATGFVYLPSTDPNQDYGGRVGYFIYNGTCDIACTRIFPTENEAWDTVRTPASHAKCTCGGEPTPVVLRTTYGGGFDWESKVCLVCKSIVGPLDNNCYNDGDFWGF